MLRRLCPAFLCLALWGCSATTSPPAETAAKRGDSSPVAAANDTTPSGQTARADKSGDPIVQTGGRGSNENSGSGSDKAPPAGPARSTTDRSGKPQADDRDASPRDAASGAVETAMTKLRRARTPKSRQRAADELEKALDAEPDNVDGMLMMVRAVQLLIEDADDDDQPTEALHHKTVVFLEKALEAEPQLPKIRGFNPFAAEVYLEDARALAREKKPAESLARLRQAVDHGFPLAALEGEDDFEAVRKLPEFATFLAQEREKVRDEIRQLLAENEPFDFTYDIKDIAGNLLSNEALKGKVVIVDFWGTWCPPCRLEIPHFVALDREYRAQGLQILGFTSEREDDAEDAAKQVRQFCRKEGVRYPCALIDDETIEKVPDFEGFPTTLFIDHTGKVRLKVVGYHDLFFLRTVVEMLLSERDAGADEKAAVQKGE
jgi:thiol-disulfide isomerase/thioredoxin